MVSRQEQFMWHMQVNWMQLIYTLFGFLIIAGIYNKTVAQVSNEATVVLILGGIVFWMSAKWIQASIEVRKWQ